MRPLLQDSREVTLTNPSGTLLVDPVDNALVTISFPHHEAHEGSMFETFWKNPDGSTISDNAMFGIVLQATSKFAHLTFEIAGGGDTEKRLYEAPTLSATGTAVTPYNMNRASGKTPTINAWTGPTLVTGTFLLEGLIPGGTGGGTAGGAGAVRQDTEWILNTGTFYVVAGINRAGTAQPGSILAQWYEATP